MLKNNNTMTTRNFHDAVFEICGDAQIETSRMNNFLKCYTKYAVRMEGSDKFSAK